MKNFALPVVCLGLLIAWISTEFAATNGVFFTSAELGNIFAGTNGVVVLQINDLHPVLNGKAMLLDEAARTVGQYYYSHCS